MRLIDEAVPGDARGTAPARWRGICGGSGWCVGRQRVRRLMTQDGLWRRSIRRPKTSEPHPQHKIYPYLLRHLTIERPNQVWCADVTYIPMRRGFLYLVAIMDWASRKVLAWRLSNTMEADFCVAALEEAIARYGKPGHLQHRSGLAVHQLRLHRHAEGRRHPHLHGWARPLDGQRLHRAAVAIAQIRMRLPHRLRDRQRGTSRHRSLDRLLQCRPPALDLRRQDARRGLCYRRKRGEIGGVIKPRSTLAKPPNCPGNRDHLRKHCWCGSIDEKEEN